MTQPSVHRTIGDAVLRFSAPARIDAGGTMDIKALAIPLESEAPVTVNIALDLRTTVEVRAFDPGWVRIVSQGFDDPLVVRTQAMPFIPPYGIFCAAVAFFGLDGLALSIQSRSPVKSGLGGSSTALVALIGVLNRLQGLEGRSPLTRDQILYLAYQLEDAVSGGHCGLQDHAAAVYGGVHEWQWFLGRKNRPYARRALLNAEGSRALDERLVVAYSGASHESGVTNRGWVEAFLKGTTRREWLAANAAVHGLGAALAARRWEEAAAFLRAETAIRRRLTPEALIPLTAELVSQAEALGCGARFAGAGAGGCVWALGAQASVQRLRDVWEAILATYPGGRLLASRIDRQGLKDDSPA